MGPQVIISTLKQMSSLQARLTAAGHDLGRLREEKAWGPKNNP
jgi:hypothetical protein